MIRAVADRLRITGRRYTTPSLEEATQTSPVTEIGDRELGHADAIAEALRVMRRLGLEPHGPLDAGDLVRFVYAQGWLACEARLASADMADAIDDALNHPGHVTDKTSTDTINTWTVRALQQTVIREAGKAHS